MKTGTMGAAWIALEKPKPPAVDDHYRYWGDPPPEMSDRCAYWLRQIERGWLPNRRWRCEGYDGATQLFGVYIWEYLNLIAPALRERFFA